MTCSICGMKPAVSRGGTCGNSYCQEAAYYRNAARNARGRARRNLERIAGEKAAVAAARV